jgi:DNA-binding NtrC family response regulator
MNTRVRGQALKGVIVVDNNKALHADRSLFLRDGGFLPVSILSDAEIQETIGPNQMDVAVLDYRVQDGKSNVFHIHAFLRLKTDLAVDLMTGDVDNRIDALAPSFGLTSYPENAFSKNQIGKATKDSMRLSEGTMP